MEYMCAHKRVYDADDDPFAALGPMPTSGSELFPMGPPHAEYVESDSGESDFNDSGAT